MPVVFILQHLLAFQHQSMPHWDLLLPSTAMLLQAHLTGLSMGHHALTELSTPYITVSSNGRTSFLKVPATVEYNNTAVVCEVTIHDPISHNESSDSAVLRVQGMLCIVNRHYMFVQSSPLIMMSQMTCLII